jgi:hypothetical protein
VCEKFSLNFRKENRLRRYQNSAERTVFTLERGREQEDGENYVIRSFVICSLRPERKERGGEFGGTCSTKSMGKLKFAYII